MTNLEATTYVEGLAVPATGACPPACPGCGLRHRHAVSCEATRTMVEPDPVLASLTVDDLDGATTVLGGEWR